MGKTPAGCSRVLLPTHPPPVIRSLGSSLPPHRLAHSTSAPSLSVNTHPLSPLLFPIRFPPTCVSCCGSSTSPHRVSPCPCATSHAAVDVHSRCPVGSLLPFPPSLPRSLPEEEGEVDDGALQSRPERSVMASAASPPMGWGGSEASVGGSEALHLDCQVEGGRTREDGEEGRGRGCVKRNDRARQGNGRRERGGKGTHLLAPFPEGVRPRAPI